MRLVYSCHKTGCLWQEGPLVPSASDPKKNSFILSQLGDTINFKRKKKKCGTSWKRSNKYSNSIQWGSIASLLQNSDDWRVALIDFRGQILFHLPSSPCSSSKFKNVSLAVEDTCETFLTLCSSFPPLYPMGEGRAVSNRSCLEKGFLSFLVLNRQYN